MCCGQPILRPVNSLRGTAWPAAASLSPCPWTRGRCSKVGLLPSSNPGVQCVTESPHISLESPRSPSRARLCRRREIGFCRSAASAGTARPLQLVTAVKERSPGGASLTRGWWPVVACAVHMFRQSGETRGQDVEESLGVQQSPGSPERALTLVGRACLRGHPASLGPGQCVQSRQWEPKECVHWLPVLLGLWQRTLETNVMLELQAHRERCQRRRGDVTLLRETFGNAASIPQPG